MFKNILFIVLMCLLIFSLSQYTKKVIPETNNRSGLKLYLLRVSVVIIPVITLAILLFWILLS